MKIDAWQLVFRKGIAQQFSDEELDALRLALVSHDESLIQGKTWHAEHGVVVAACAIAYPWWQVYSAAGTELDDRFARVCDRAEEIVGVGEADHCTNWSDGQPREVVFPLLLREVQAEIVRRAAAAAAADQAAAARAAAAARRNPPSGEPTASPMGRGLPGRAGEGLRPKRRR